MYNADLLRRTDRDRRPIRALTPILMDGGIAYPSPGTGSGLGTLAMFTPVAFHDAVGARSRATCPAMNNPEQLGGGFDVRAQAAPTNLVVRMRARSGAPRGSTQPGSRSSRTVLPRRRGEADRARRRLPPTTACAVLTSRSSATRRTASRRWPAATRAPTRSGAAGRQARSRRGRRNRRSQARQLSAGAVLLDFKLQGFVLEDGVFDPLTPATRDPQTGKKLQLTVIGILAGRAVRDAGDLDLAGDAGRRLRRPGAADGLLLRARRGLRPASVALQPESVFVANGLEADALEELLEDSTAVQLTFNRLIQGFMGLGLDHRRHRRARGDQRAGSCRAAADRDPPAPGSAGA